MNLTSELTGEEIIIASHKLSAVPSIIITLITAFILFLIVGMITFDTSKGRQKFFITWIISLVIIVGISVFFIYSPFIIQDIANFFKNLWI